MMSETHAQGTKSFITTKKSASSSPYRYKRYIVYGIASAVLMIFPFIKINGNQLFLLSFDHKQLHLLGTVFDMQEMYLMPFLLIMLFVGIFFITSLLGRVWCGWACPQTIFRVLYRDFLQTDVLQLRKKIANKQEKMQLDTLEKKIKAFLAFIMIAVLCLCASANLMFFFTPPGEFIAYMSDPLNHRVLLGFWLGFGAFFILDITFIQENFCIYMCPYCRVQSVLFDNDTLLPLYDYKRGGEVYDTKGIKFALSPQKQNPHNECTNCAQCVRVCPTHIDIRKGSMQLECINCLECVDACTKVMGSLGKETLVNWKSSNWLESYNPVRFVRLKTIAYTLILAFAACLLFVVGSHKEGMLLDISRTSELYEIKSNHIVDNHYTMLFHNTDSVEHKIYFEILDTKDNNIANSLTIVRPKEAFNIRAGGKKKQIVKIRTKDEMQAGSYDIIIRAYALDDKEKVFVERKTNFVYPSKDKFKD